MCMIFLDFKVLESVVLLTLVECGVKVDMQKRDRKRFGHAKNLATQVMERVYLVSPCLE